MTATGANAISPVATIKKTGTPPNKLNKLGEAHVALSLVVFVVFVVVK